MYHAVLFLMCLVLHTAIFQEFVQPSFRFQSDTDRGRVADLEQLFKDAIQEARVVPAMFNDCELTLLPRFAKSHICFVKNLVRTIANMPLNANIKKDDFQQYLIPFDSISTWSSLDYSFLSAITQVLIKQT